MKQKIYLIAGIILIILAALLFLSQNNLPTNPNLEFSYGSCEGPFSGKLEKYESHWLDDSTLQVETCVFLNAGIKKIIKADYEISGDTIILKYKPARCSPVCLKGVGQHELIYKIKNLEKKEYQFELKKT